VSEDEKSHDDYIEQGLEDYRNSFGDWELDLLIDHIIILSDFKKQIDELISHMKGSITNNYVLRESK